MKSNTKNWDKILEQQIMSSKMTFSVNTQSSKGLSSVADQITQQSYTYNSPEVKWLQLDKSKINNSADSKIMSLAIQLKEYENSGHMNVRMQLKALAAQALHEAGYPNDYTIDDYMRANGMLPPLQEDPEMIRQLQRQIIEMQESSRNRDVLLEQINQNNLQLIQGLTEAEHIINEKDEIIAGKNEELQHKDEELQHKDEIITEKDNTIELQANQLQDRNNTIIARDDTILQLQGDKDNLIETNTDLTNRLAISEENNDNLTNANTDLTNRLATSEENNGNLTEELHEVRESNLDLINRLATSEENNGNLTEELHEVRESNLDLTNRLANSEAKVGPLQQEVFGLKRDKEMLEIDKKNLQDDKNELREDKKMLVDDKKMLQEEKKLLLVDKKLLQDLNLEQAFKITDLSQIHCNVPDHLKYDYEIINVPGMGMGSNIPQNDND